MALNNLEAANILREIAYIRKRQEKIWSYFQGTEIPSVKIENLAADKITTGVLSAVATLGGASTNAAVIIDGEENRILIRDESSDNRVLLGKQEGGF